MSARRTTAVLIACKNGEATIAATVRSAVAQADVYVVSDGSTDGTVAVAMAAGARVLAQDVSTGKPAALRAGSDGFDLSARYDYVAILDDDTTIEPEYVALTTGRMEDDAAIAAASGRIDAIWTHRHRWNALVAMRAFMYWSYQSTIKRGQNTLHVVNVVCGANTIFKAKIFAQLIEKDAPYAIDDMYWLAEIVRLRLGRVAYVHDARSWTVDPHRFTDWYRQTVRWSWGQFQSIRGHGLGQPIQPSPGRRLGLRVSWFDVAYLALLVDWLPYMLEPFVLPPAAYFLRGWVDPLWFAAFYLGGSILWIAVAAVALRKPRLLVLAPSIIVLDLVYRVAMIHAVIKAIIRPRVDNCAWDSPVRFALPALPPASNPKEYA